MNKQKSDFLKSWQRKQRRIIIFAGIFDPVHMGHIQAAKEALKFGSTVYLCPERQPWHKQGVTDYEHRLAMLQAAVSEYSSLEALDYPHDQHAIQEFFGWIHEQFPDTPVSWLVGSDVAPHISKWEGVEMLPDLGVDEILVAGRKNQKFGSTNLVPGVQIRTFRTRNHHMSSSYIRENVKSRHTALPLAVQDYVKSHKLYQ